MTKKSIIATISVIVLIAVSVFAYTQMQNTAVEDVYLNKDTNITDSVEKDLNQIDTTTIDKDIESLNKDINGL